MTKPKKEKDFIGGAICRNCKSLFKDEDDNFLCGEKSHLVYGIKGTQITDRLKETCSFFADTKKLVNINCTTMLKRLKKVKEEEEKNTTKSTSLLINNNKKLIAEQIFNGEGTKFCVWQDGKIHYQDSVYDNGLTYYPLEGEEISKGAIHLPSKALEYGTDAELNEEIKTFITTWLDIPEDVLQFAVWNIKRSWVYERFHTLNYLRALGDTGQGKSRFLDALGYIHYKPINTSGATTSAPVFRAIDKWKGTLVMDEADFQKSDESQDIIKIINQGYEKGRFVMRCDKDNNDKINFFDPYCPKILATRNTFYDKAVESRCITQVMTGTMRRDIPRNLNKNFFDKALELRNKLLMWRFNNYFKIDTEAKIEFDVGELEPRVEQIVSSFISLFKDDNEQLEKFKIFIKNYQEELIDERRNSFDGQIIAAIHSLLEKGVVDIAAIDIIDEGQITNKKGQPIKPRGLSSSLKSLGFKKTELRRLPEKTKRCIPLEPAHLRNLFERYGYDVTVVTMYTDISATIKNKDKSEQKDLKKNVYGKEHINRYNRYSVTENDQVITESELIEDNPKTTTQSLKTHIKAVLTKIPKDTDTIAKELSRSVGEIYAFLKELANSGEIMENPSDHWSLL